MKYQDPAGPKPAPPSVHAAAPITHPSPFPDASPGPAFRRPDAARLLPAVALLAAVLLAAAVPQVVSADNPSPAFADSTRTPMAPSSGAVSPDAPTLPPAAPSAPGAATQPQPLPVMDALRARLTGGAVFFGDSTLVRDESAGTAQYASPQFNAASPYLAFEVQPRLWPTTDPLARDSYRRVYLEGIANMRLTAIGATGAAVGDAGILRPDASVLKSQKSAQLQLGALLSINGRGFDVLGTRFHWGWGPIYRRMFQTVTDAQRNRRVWNAEDDLYDAHTIGMRFSLYSRPEDSPTSWGWTPTAYIDFTSGLFENFELVRGDSDAVRECLANPALCLGSGAPPIADFSVKQKWRTYIEGRVFIQSIYLGFDLNNGEGPDDMRFMAGFTLDLSRFLGLTAE